MERAAFLARLRSRLLASAPPHRPIASSTEPPAIAYALDLGDLVGAFTEQATTAGAVVRPTDDLGAFLREVVEETGAERVVVSRDPESEAAAAALRDLGDLPDSGGLPDVGLDVRPFDGPDPAADLGVVGAAWAIAATGTVVFDAARAGGRSASLLPPAVCVLLSTDRILADASALFRVVEDDPPSQLVLSTGPSKTGDIEQQLITGVHGPGQVWIGLVRL